MARDGVASRIVTSLPELASTLDDNVGVVLMTEEALMQPDWSALTSAVTSQPSWSSYPFLLLVSQQRNSTGAHGIYSRMPAEISNIMVLERPIGSGVLLSAVRWALGGRRRQFVTRDHLAELERNSQQQKLMTRELAHRVKNTIAMLQSIVSQTTRLHPEMSEVSQTIIGRFSALSRAHDLLLGRGFTAADFGDLVERALMVHEGPFHIEGPPLQLSPQASLSFALVLHELATNSAKYGALSVAGGLVSILWSVTEGDDTIFNFGWRERGGPEVTEPKTTGFGSRLVRATLSAIGSLEMNYPPEGFELAFTGDLGELTHIVTPEFANEDTWPTCP